MFATFQTTLQYTKKMENKVFQKSDYLNFVIIIF